jgi:hypothetical protein
MPGYDEETVRKAREDEEATSNPAMGDTGLGGTGRTGDVGAGGAIGDAALDRMGGAQDELGEVATSGVRGSGTFDPNDDVGRGSGATGAGGGADMRTGTGTYDVDDDLGGIGGTGMANAEQGSGAQNRMTTGIGAAGDQTDEDLLEGR